MNYTVCIYGIRLSTQLKKQPKSLFNLSLVFPIGRHSKEITSVSRLFYRTQVGFIIKKMPKTDTLDALENEMKPTLNLL